MSKDINTCTPIKRVATVDLIPYANNSRVHSDEQVNQIAASIKEFGFLNPIIVDGDNGIIAGHGRVMAANKLGIKELPCVDASHLSEAQKKAYVIADNKIALNSDWDVNVLRVEFEALKELDFDLTLTGFSLDELSDFEIEELAPEYEEDADGEIIEPPPEPKTKDGDVWILGKHRLMCGDSTSIDAVDKLMNKHTVPFGFCDPPYNLGFRYNSYDDNKPDSEYIEFSREWFANLKAFTQRQAVTLGTKNIPIMANLSDVAGVGCWVKKNWITGCHIAKLQQWEPIFFYGDYTKHKRTSDLYEINRKVQIDVGDQHSCPKQIELIVDIIENYTEKHDGVLDLFGGSGTTIIACEKLSRIGYSMELDPRYCDVIINRWQTLTGKDATLESTGEKFNDL